MSPAQLHYPGSYAEQRAWFPDDAACLDYLDWLRWTEADASGVWGRDLDIPLL